MQTATYDPAVARAFFMSAGTPADIAEGKKIFGEKERAIPLLRAQKVYLLLKGEVGLVNRKQPIARVRPGEIFGEMALISGAPRSASAIANTACRVIELDAKQFETALARKPEFAVMLMSVMIHRLRETIAQLKDQNAFSKDEEWHEAAAIRPAHLAELVSGIADDTPSHFGEGARILAEGQKGLRMYAVLEGRVRISIAGRVVERLGPGGVFGEIALVDPSEKRVADAVADTDASLLPITRDAFLTLVKMSPRFAHTILVSLAERLRFLTARLG